MQYRKKLMNLWLSQFPVWKSIYNNNLDAEAGKENDLHQMSRMFEVNLASEKHAIANHLSYKYKVYCDIEVLKLVEVTMIPFEENTLTRLVLKEENTIISLKCFDHHLFYIGQSADMNKFLDIYHEFESKSFRECSGSQSIRKCIFESILRLYSIKIISIEVTAPFCKLRNVKTSWMCKRIN